jgi:hypothetical protein
MTPAAGQLRSRFNHRQAISLVEYSAPSATKIFSL